MNTPSLRMPPRNPFSMTILSSSTSKLHQVKVSDGTRTIAEFLLKGQRVQSSVVAEPERLPRFKRAALSLIEMGACGGNFDF